jgi:rod shape-determining protein MreD
VRRNGAIVLLVLGSLLIQSTFIGILPLKVKPDLVFVVVVLFALLNGERSGMVVGSLAGLLQDILRGRLIGMNLLALALTSYAVGWLENKIFKDNFLVPVVVVFLASLLHGLFMIMFTRIAGLDSSWQIGLRIGLIEALYNTILVPLIYGKFLISTNRGFLKS